jgi:aspartyl-tRNA(Asn)/glutamyl-tRNA(Gln) amidotransferase subunit C
MKITREEVRQVAHLARLNVTGEQIDAFAQQIGRILDYIDQLNQLDTTGVTPTFHASAQTNAFRDDEAQAHLDREAALANAPEEDDGSYIVPKVIG